jgi:hypothetical protein
MFDKYCSKGRSIFPVPDIREAKTLIVDFKMIISPSGKPTMNPEAMGCKWKNIYLLSDSLPK